MPCFLSLQQINISLDKYTTDKQHGSRTVTSHKACILEWTHKIISTFRQQLLPSSNCPPVSAQLAVQPQENLHKTARTRLRAQDCTHKTARTRLHAQDCAHKTACTFCAIFLPSCVHSGRTVRRRQQSLPKCQYNFMTSLWQTTDEACSSRQWKQRTVWDDEGCYASNQVSLTSVSLLQWHNSQTSILELHINHSLHFYTLTGAGSS